MRLTPQWSLYNRRLAAAAAPPPAFDPVSLFVGAERGVVIDFSDNNAATNSNVPIAVGQGAERIIPSHLAASTYAGSLRGSAFIDKPLLQSAGGLYWLEFVGANSNSFSAPSWFPNTGAVTIIAGIRRGQSANTEDLFGLSANPPDNTQSFSLAATYDAASNTAGFASRGSNANVAAARAVSMAVGTDYVLTGIGNISTDTCISRRNGVQTGSDTVDQGSGNYAPFGVTAYLGSRGNSSRYFTGRLYAMIIIHRVLTAGELANAEAWVASKCGITI